VKTIRAILHAILNNGPPLFVLLHNAEISMEMDPGTFGIEQLQALKELGINRISLGVQSFHDDVLQSIGRFHRRDDVLQSIDMLREVYGENVNYSMDLISGLPGTSLAMWAETLAMATNLSPRHFSIYDLQIESGTVFSKWYENDGGTLPVPNLPSPDDCAFAYRYASSYLRAKGYEHYEISSYAYKSKDSPSCYYRSRHNQIYWEPKSSWFAFGLGATSFVHGNRYARPKALTDYVAWVKNGGTRDAHRARDEAACPNTLDWLTDVIMTRLRTSDGLDLDWIKDNAPNGDVVVEQILTGASLGLELGLAARHIHKKKSLGTLRLADPDGFLFSNSIISSIFVELGVDE
jgi:oxygen-independent coproporphyrinogen-3 oxidase